MSININHKKITIYSLFWGGEIIKMYAKQNGDRTISQTDGLQVCVCKMCATERIWAALAIRISLVQPGPPLIDLLGILSSFIYCSFVDFR